MSIEKKSLISTLRTTKKANVAKEDFTNAGSASSAVKSPNKLAARVLAGKSAARVLAGKSAAKVSAARVAGHRKLAAKVAGTRFR